MASFHATFLPTPAAFFAAPFAPQPGAWFTANFADNASQLFPVNVINLTGLVTSLNNGAGSLAALPLSAMTVGAIVEFTLPVSVTGYSGNAVLCYTLSVSGASTSNPKVIASTATPGMIWTLGSCSINGQICALNQTDNLFYPTQAITFGGVVTATIAAVGFSFL